MEMETLRDLYVEGLKDLYSAENQLIKALPKMAKASTSEELRTGFEKHLEQTKEHAVRLERIFKALGENPKCKHCKGMEGLIEEGSEIGVLFTKRTFSPPAGGANPWNRQVI